MSEKFSIVTRSKAKFLAALQRNMTEGTSQSQADLTGASSTEDGTIGVSKPKHCKTQKYKVQIKWANVRGNRGLLYL